MGLLEHLPPICARKEKEKRTVCSESTGEVFILPDFPLESSKDQQKRKLKGMLLPELSGSMSYLSSSLI